MIEIKEICNTLTNEEFISKSYLQKIAREIINSHARALFEFSSEDFNRMYSRTCGVLDAYCEIGLLNEYKKDSFVNAILRNHFSSDDFVGVPQINDANDIYYI